MATHKIMIESKRNKFINEQKEIINNLFDILQFDISKINNEITLYHLENDKNKLKKIKDLYDNIQKYFFCGNIKGFTNKECKRPWLSIIKCVFRQYGYKIVSSGTYVKVNNNRIKTQLFNIMMINLK